MAIQLILPAQPPVNMHILFFYLKPKCWCRAIFGRGGLDWWPPTTCGKHLTIQISFLPYLWLIKTVHCMSWAHKPSLNSDLWTDIPLLSKKFLTISGACNNVCVQGFRTTCNGIHMLREGSKYHRWARAAVSLDSQINWVDQDHETTITPKSGFFSLFWQTFHLPSVITFSSP